MVALDKAYKIIGNGSLEGCAKGACPTGCCKSKDIAAITGEPDTYAVLLQGETELKVIQAMHGRLEDLGIEAKKILLSQQGIALAIDKCFDPETGKCKLETFKPFGCRLYPFGIDAKLAIDPECFRAQKILNNSNALRKILRLRTALGFFDHKNWLENAHKLANKESGNPGFRYV